MQTKKNSIIASCILLLLFVIATLVTLKVYQDNSISYQMRRLEGDDPKELIKAATFIGDNEIKEAIPLLINHIDNNERYYWDNEPKGGQVTVSCVVTFELEMITGLDFGNTCYDFNKTDDEYIQIQNRWKDWFYSEFNE